MSYNNMISPTLSATSSRSASASASQTTSFDIPQTFAFPMDKALEFDDLFNFSDMESQEASSHSHSPATNVPHTPSPVASTSMLPSIFAWPGNDVSLDEQFAFASKPVADDNMKVKQEPVEFAFASGSGSHQGSQSPHAVQVAPQPVLAPSNPQPTEQVDWMNTLSTEQQLALQQLMFNLANFSGNNPPAQQVQQPAYQAPNQFQQQTVQPSMVFSTSPTLPSGSSSGSEVSPTSAAPPQMSPVTTMSQPTISRRDSGSGSSQRSASPPLRSIRQDTAFSLNADLDNKIDNLTPLPAIFSTGRGKGGKKGGGMSSVVRMEDEDLDDDDSWRPSPEEYKKLSSKEKRQLRNKLSARAFRTRRKDYIGTLQSHIKDRDSVIDAIRAELINSRSENNDLRRELAAMKASTMTVLHPETANRPSQPPVVMNSLAMAPPPAPVAGPSNSHHPPRRTPTPVFNPRKDVSATAYFESKQQYWGGNDPMSGGGSTICHTLFTPDLVLPKESTSPTSFPAFPRTNLNPLLNTTDAHRGPALQSAGQGRDLSSTFDEWTESTPFSLRTMDSYREQMWSRLVREAEAEKANTPLEMRPKFFVEPKAAVATSTSASIAKAASSSPDQSSSDSLLSVSSTPLTSRLVSSFLSAFQGSSSKMDKDKLTAVVTGAAKLKAAAESRREKMDEKSAATRRVTIDEADALCGALSGLKLQAGTGARANPLGALSGFLTSAMPARA